MDLTLKQIKDAFNSCSVDRKRMERVESYYEGRQANSELAGVRSDGRPKAQSRTNYTRSCVDQHTAFLLSDDVRYVLKPGNLDAASITELERLYDANDLDQVDSRHLANAILYGRSVEVHSWNGVDPVITACEPEHWGFLRDQDRNIVVAIYRVELETGTVYNGAVLEKPVVLYYVYDSANIVVHEEIGKESRVVSTTPHRYGRLPVVVFAISEDWKPLWGNSFYDACDNADVVMSSLIDSIRYDVDAMLLLKGVKLDELLAKDPNGVAVITKLRSMGILPLKAEGQEAEYLTRTVDTTKFAAALDRLEDSIHLQSYTPNLRKLIEGGLSNVSGVALRLVFAGMLSAARQMSQWIEKGLRERVELINRINSLVGRPVLVSYEIKFETNLPSNSTELLQYLGNLQGVLATEDQIKLLPFVDRPDLAYQNLLAERANKPAQTPKEISTEEDIVDNGASIPA